MEDTFQVSWNMLFSERVLKKWLGKTTCILPKHGKDTSQTERFGRYEAFTYFKAKYLQTQNIFLKIFLKEIKYLFKCPFMNMCYSPDYTTLLLLKTKLILRKCSWCFEIRNGWLWAFSVLSNELLLRYGYFKIENKWPILSCRKLSLLQGALFLPVEDLPLSICQGTANMYMERHLFYIMTRDMQHVGQLWRGEDLQSMKNKVMRTKWRKKYFIFRKGRY